MQTQNDFEPSWLAEENDARHREETAPLLFGDGSIDLQDPLPFASPGGKPPGEGDGGGDGDVVENDRPSSKRRRQPRKGGGKARKGSEGYGSLNPKSSSKRTGDLPGDDGADTDNDDDNDGTDVEEASNSGKQKKKQQQQQGAKKTTSLSSLFSTSTLIPKRKASHATTKSAGGAAAAAATASPQKVTPLTAAALRAKPHVPGINPCLWLFHTLQGVCVVAALMLCVTQVIPLVLAARQKSASVVSTVGWASVALKAYITSFCLVFVAVETDLPIPFLRDSNLFQRYLSRGFLYSFLGLICLEEAYSERVRDIVKKSSSLDNVGWAAIFMQLSSWLMLAVGCLYMLMGVCCLKGLRDRLKEREQREWREYREALKRWKDVYT